MLPSSSRMYDIPCLSLSGQCRDLRAWTYLAWGARARNRLVDPVCAYHFYVDDDRFSRLWRVPELLVATGVRRVVEVNYSCFDTTSEAEAIYAVYKKRWLSQFWQSRSIDVVVDLNASQKHSRLNLEGVPDGWRSFATRGYRGKEDQLRFEYALAVEKCGDESAVEFMVYGGGKAVMDLCYCSGWYYVQDYMTERGRDKQWQRQDRLVVHQPE